MKNVKIVPYKSGYAIKTRTILIFVWAYARWQPDHGPDGDILEFDTEEDAKEWIDKYGV